MACIRELSAMLVCLMGEHEKSIRALEGMSSLSRRHSAIATMSQKASGKASRTLHIVKMFVGSGQ